MATVGVVAGIALLGIGVASVKMAGDFQQSVNRLRTGAGDTKDSFSSLSAGIERVAVVTGTLTKPLADAMYLILSSGQRGAQAYNTLEVAAKGAVIEQAKVADVANVLSGVMTNYGTKLFSATDYMNGLITAVAHGKITLQDLSVAMGPIDPIARDLGISFAATAAAMTTQTNAMIPASRAATGLRFMLLALENPTTKAKNEMESLGLSTVAVADEMKVSLPGALQLIYDAAKKAGPEGSVPFNRAIADMVGGIRGFTAFTALTGTHMKEFIANVNLITDAMKRHNAEVQGWEIAQSNFNVQMDRAKVALQVVGIELGTKLIPLLTSMVQKLVPIIEDFGKWATSSSGLAGELQNVVKWVDAFFTQMQKNGAARELVTIFKNLAEAVKNVVVGGLETLGMLLNVTNTNADKLKGSAQGVADGLKKIFDGAVILSGALKTVTGWFTDTGIKGVILRDVLIGVGLAVATVKFAELGAALITLAMVTIPAALVKFGLLAAAQTATAVATAASATQLTLWTGEAVAATTASTGLATGEVSAATAAAGLAVSFTAALGPIALLTGGILLAKQAVDAFNNSQPIDVTKLPGISGGIPNAGKLIHDLQNIGNAAKDTSTKVDRSIQDMIDAYKRLNDAWAIAGKAIVNTNITTATQQEDAFLTWLAKFSGTGLKFSDYWKMIQQQIQETTTRKWATITQIIQHQLDVQQQVVRSKWDVITQVIQQQTDNEKRVVGDKWSAISDIIRHQTDSQNQAVRDKWLAISQTIANQSSYEQNQVSQKYATITQIIRNQMSQAVSVVQSKWDQISAILSQQFYVNAHVNVSTSYSGAGTFKHATGILDSPFGHMAVVGEKGPEMMWVPKGASIFPNGQGPTALSSATLGMNMNSGGAGQQPVNVLVYIDGTQIGQYAGRRVADGIRVSTGIRR